jgi:hypothetical protein
LEELLSHPRPFCQPATGREGMPGGKTNRVSVVVVVGHVGLDFSRTVRGEKAGCFIKRNPCSVRFGESLAHSADTSAEIISALQRGFSVQTQPQAKVHVA